MGNNSDETVLKSEFSAYSDDEIDLRELVATIWAGKLTIIAVTIVAAALSVAIALASPNIYRAEALLASAEDDKGGGLSGMASQYGGLASLAGINIRGLRGGDRIDEGLAILQSRQFIGDFIKRRELLVPLMAAKRWDKMSGRLELDPDIYDEASKRWVREVKPPRTPEPSVQEAHKVFQKKHLIVGLDKKTNFVTIAVEHLSPVVAQQWVEWLVADLNNAFKVEDVASAERSIAYLQAQLEKTAVADLHNVFYQLIEGQMKTIMLANGRDEYLFRTLDPPIVPERKFKPKRALIVAVGTLAGLIVAVCFVLVRHGLRTEREAE